MLRPARPGDLSEIVVLLTESGLPTQGVADVLKSFVVAESEGGLIGVGGIEFHGCHALLRSVAVSHGHRRRGVAAAICDYLEAQAADHGVESICVLTETAEHFFMGRNYEAAARSVAPAAIAASDEFAAICPQSATFMRRAL